MARRVFSRVLAALLDAYVESMRLTDKYIYIYVYMSMYNIYTYIHIFFFKYSYSSLVKKQVCPSVTGI